MRKVRMTVFIEELEVQPVEGTDEFENVRVGPICRRTADFDAPGLDGETFAGKEWEAEFARMAGQLGKFAHRQYALNKAEAE